jgi:hypothetical protein
MVKVLSHLEQRLEIPIKFNGDRMITRNILTMEFKVKVGKRVKVWSNG